MRGRPNWEHLEENLHVLIQCEDTPNRAKVKLQRAHELVKQLLIPAVSKLEFLLLFISWRITLLENFIRYVVNIVSEPLLPQLV